MTYLSDSTISYDYALDCLHVGGCLRGCGRGERLLGPGCQHTCIQQRLAWLLIARLPVRRGNGTSWLFHPQQGRREGATGD